jgi:outer membrane protein
VKRSFTAKSRIGLIALVALMASVPAWSETKIGYVDFQRLAEESPQMKTLRDSIQAEFGPKQRELQTLVANGKARQDKLQKDAATMSDDQKQRAEKELRDLQRDLERRNAELQDDFNARRNEEMGRLQRSLIEEVRAYAKAQNFDLIVSDAIYATSALDITPAILSTLQAHAPAAASGATSKPASSGGSSSGKSSGH